MKSAKEMFEELGFYIQFECVECIWYKEKKTDIPINIRFHKVDKTIESWVINRLAERMDARITPQLLQAINKQVEELGWK